MKIATLGLPLPTTANSSIAHFSFMQPQSLSDIDTVIWNVEALLPELEREIEQHDPNVLSVRGSETLLATSRHWRHQFKKLLAKGGTIVVFIPPSMEIGIHTLQEMMLYDPLEPLNSASLETEAITASTLTCTAGEPFRSLFEDIKPLLKPTVALKKYPGAPIFHDENGHVLACYHAKTPGQLIFLPSLNAEAWTQSDHAQTFFTSLQRCIERFGMPLGISNATWLNQYVLDSEREALQAYSSNVRQLGEIQEKIRAIERNINGVDFFKQVVGGISFGVYIAVAQVFRARNAFVQSDWVHSNVLIIELADRYVAVQIRLPDEVVDARYVQDLHDTRQRINEYFSKPVTVLVVDCWQNNLPLPNRQDVLPESALITKEGFLYIDGQTLYGWHIEQSADTTETFIQHIKNDSQGYLEQLKSNVREQLSPVSTPTLRPTSSSHDTVALSDIYDR